MEELKGTLMKFFIMYLICINLFGFFIMWLDKRKAKRNEWRIKEYTLFLVTALGGGFGTVAGMYVFRHKTKKLLFRIGMPMILIFEIIIAIRFIFF